MSEFDADAMAEALYLESFPYEHQGRPSPVVYLDLPQWQRDLWKYRAENLIDMYRNTRIPVAQRTLKLRDVNPGLHAKIHGT